MSNIKAKMPHFYLGWGSTPDPTGGAQVQYSRTNSPRPLSWILGVLLIRGGKGRVDRGWEGEGRGGKRKWNRGGRKRKSGGKGSPGKGNTGGKGMEGINLQHGRLNTLAALLQYRPEGRGNNVLIEATGFY